MNKAVETPAGKRRVAAQRGTALRCKGWRQEVILRMLENNLENGERPEDLVIYMSAARAARDWPSFDRIVAALQDLGNEETLVVQSGKPIARFATHGRAPRVLMANGNVVGHWADDAGFYRLEQLGLTVIPGMTAAAWQYIGSQGIVQGTYQSFAGAGELYFGGSLKGRVIVTAGCGGMSGAQPLAGKMAGAATLVVEVNRSRLQRRLDTGYLDVLVDSLDEAVARIEALKAAGAGGSVGLHANCVEVYEALLARGFQPDVVTDQCMVDPRRGYVPVGLTPEQAAELVRSNPDEALRRAADTLARHARAVLEFKRRGAIAFEYGNQFRARSAQAGVEPRLLPRHRAVPLARGLGRRQGHRRGRRAHRGDLRRAAPDPQVDSHGAALREVPGPARAHRLARAHRAQPPRGAGERRSRKGPHLRPDRLHARPPRRGLGGEPVPRDREDA
jgi:urocanate hydratase